MQAEVRLQQGATQAATIQQPAHVAMATENPPHVTAETWVTDITAKHIGSSGTVGGGDPMCAINVLPVRTREEAGIDEGQPATAPAPKHGRKNMGSKSKRPKKLAAPPVQTRMIKGK